MGSCFICSISKIIIESKGEMNEEKETTSMAYFGGSYIIC